MGDQTTIDEQPKEEFDEKIMTQSFEKAIRINEKLKLKLSTDLLQSMATTLFTSTMQNIRENKKQKAQYNNY